MKKFKTPQEYISYVELELESANHHDYIDLPEKLFNKIVDEINPIEQDKLTLARVIAEEFYNNI
ncbi:MAG: hypothetical protein Q7R95_07325 [bacterium]|nr:hypothetical protein [bacterium]